MENEFIPKSKFSECFDALCKDYVFLAIVSFVISFINLKYFGSVPFVLKILISFVPALLYSIKAKVIAKPRFVLAYAGIYVCFYFAKLCCMYTGFNLAFGNILFMFLFSGIRILVFVIYEFICSLAVFWLTNLIVYGILKLIAKSKRT